MLLFLLSNIHMLSRFIYGFVCAFFFLCKILPTKGEQLPANDKRIEKFHFEKNQRNTIFQMSKTYCINVMPLDCNIYVHFGKIVRIIFVKNCRLICGIS